MFSRVVSVCLFFNSVTRLLVYVFNLGHLQQWNFARNHTLFCQNRFKMLQKLNKPFKYCQILLKFYQSGKISPNLITLFFNLSCVFYFFDVAIFLLVHAVKNVIKSILIFCILSFLGQGGSTVRAGRTGRPGRRACHGGSRRLSDVLFISSCLSSLSRLESLFIGSL